MNQSKLFYLLPPQRLPKNIDEIQTDGIYLEILSKFLLDLTLDNCDNLLAITENLLNLFSKQIENFIPIKNDENETIQNRDNDMAFNIIRVDGHVMNILVFSLLNTYHIMIKDMSNYGTSLEKEYIYALLQAFYTILDFYKDPSINHEPNFLNEDFYTFKPYSSNNAYLRWIHGHYAFMVFIQSLIVSLNCFNYDLSLNNYETANIHLKRASILMKGSEAALRYTGEFSQDAYNESVRPTLMPPIAKPEMSGLHWRDHQFMIKNNFLNLRKLFFDAPSVIRPTIDEFQNSLKQAYDAHKYVCQKFVGNSSFSLRSTKPAVHVLENFKISRLKLISFNNK